MKFKKSITALLVAVMCFMTVGNSVQAQEANQEEVAFEADAVVDSQETIVEQENKQTETTEQEKSEEALPLAQGSTAIKETVKKTTVKKKVTTNTTKKVKSTKKELAYTKAELRLMSCIIFSEANCEPYAGKLAVGIVVMNRKKSKAFPNTVKKVIYQRYQFGPARNGSLARALRRYDAGKFKSSREKDCIKAAKAALNGKKVVSYRGRKINMKNYLFFSTRVRGYRLQIAHHQFK